MTEICEIDFKLADINIIVPWFITYSSYYLVPHCPLKILHDFPNVFAPYQKPCLNYAAGISVICPVYFDLAKSGHGLTCSSPLPPPPPHLVDE